MNFFEELQKINSGAKQNELLSKYTSFHIGGPAKFFVTAKSIDELQQILRLVNEQSVKWAIIGGASNVIAGDDGFDGLIIQTGFDEIRIEGTDVHIEAGAVTAVVASKIAAAGLAGFEWAAGVPGRIGGAIYGNAGAMGGEMKDVVISVDILDSQSFEQRTLRNQECEFEYRESRFKKTRDIILGCAMKLTVGDCETSKAKIKEFLNYRNTTQPKGFASCGCMFKNYEPAPEELDALRENGVPEKMLEKRRISAGWLIDHSGAKEFREGGVAVSDVHANFLINVGRATAKDVNALIDKVRTRVAERFGVSLEQEAQLI